MHTNDIQFESIYQEIVTLLESDAENSEKLSGICDILHTKIPHYDWVGFYLTDSEKDGELVLGPYVGEATDHVRIPFGKGICGQAAERKETFIIQDVSKETNYLSCSPVVKSEIVAPILKNGVVLGELDIDSHQLSPFTSADQAFIEGICELLTEIVFE